MAANHSYAAALIDRVRVIALAFPGAIEKLSHGEAAFLDAKTAK